jgi:hypothetical protein
MKMGILKALSWKPTGRRLYHWPDLEDGRRVQGYYGSGPYREPIKDGIIERESRFYDFDQTKIERVYVRFTYQGSVIRELLCRKNYGRWQHGYAHFELFTVNLIKENQSMANKLLGLIKLNKNQRKLQKVGIYDENGNLTADGQEVVLNLIAKDYEARLVELSKDWKIDDKKKSED